MVQSYFSMPAPDLSPIVTDHPDLPLFSEKKVKVDVLRLDKMHEIISGNKWFKLKFYLEEAQQQQKDHIITFGGAWSNHIVATAAACRLHGLKATGIIRGEKPSLYSATLDRAAEMGMQFIFLSREEYKEKKLPVGLSAINYYIIPEGGYGLQGAKGAATIADVFVPGSYTHIVCAVGTGTTMAGLINACPLQQVTGISVMKNNFELEKNISSLLNHPQYNFKLLHDHHFGGYAKYTPALIQFMNDLYVQTGIATDFVYTGKLFFAVTGLIRENYFPQHSKILVIHSGGLQGNASLEKGTLIF